MKTVESCAICLAERKNPVKPLNCMHVFCHNCLEQWSHEHDSCPICRQTYQYIECNFNENSGEFEKLSIVKRIIREFNNDIDQMRRRLRQRSRTVDPINIRRWQDYIIQRYGSAFGSESPAVRSRSRLVTSPPTSAEIESSRNNALNTSWTRNLNSQRRVIRNDRDETDPRRQIQVIVEASEETV